jgi:hypothetical protein
LDPCEAPHHGPLVCPALGTAEAAAFVRDGIRRYNASQGNSTGYHETITLAWLAVIGRFLEGRDESRSVADLSAELLEECGDKDHLLRYYSRDRLFSEEARARWVPPDLAPIV